ncbi:predicted protein [Chaetoceros tenuissimus]|uniref:Uncharacterized protein n=1 Tax=Chaetoceros tenuissimus TaxID=426638 RepID=A0AAD3HEQ9_9STRA|nr:predicted protein [Chaetoceros tenuissimus]
MNQSTPDNEGSVRRARSRLLLLSFLVTPFANPCNVDAAAFSISTSTLNEFAIKRTSTHASSRHASSTATCQYQHCKIQPIAATKSITSTTVSSPSKRISSATTRTSLNLMPSDLEMLADLSILSETSLSSTTLSSAAGAIPITTQPQLFTPLLEIMQVFSDCLIAVTGMQVWQERNRLALSTIQKTVESNSVKKSVMSMLFNSPKHQVSAVMSHVSPFEKRKHAQVANTTAVFMPTFFSGGNGGRNNTDSDQDVEDELEKELRDIKSMLNPDQVDGKISLESVIEENKVDEEKLEKDVQIPEKLEEKRKEPSFMKAKDIDEDNESDQFISKISSPTKELDVNLTSNNEDMEIPSKESLPTLKRSKKSAKVTEPKIESESSSVQEKVHVAEPKIENNSSSVKDEVKEAMDNVKEIMSELSNLKSTYTEIPNDDEAVEDSQNFVVKNNGQSTLLDIPDIKNESNADEILKKSSAHEETVTPIKIPEIPVPQVPVDSLPKEANEGIQLSELEQEVDSPPFFLEEVAPNTNEINFDSSNYAVTSKDTSDNQDSKQLEDINVEPDSNVTPTSIPTKPASTSMDTDVPKKEPTTKLPTTESSEDSSIKIPTGDSKSKLDVEDITKDIKTNSPKVTMEKQALHAKPVDEDMAWSEITTTANVNDDFKMAQGLAEAAYHAELEKQSKKGEKRKVPFVLQDQVKKDMDMVREYAIEKKVMPDVAKAAYEAREASELLRKLTEKERQKKFDSIQFNDPRLKSSSLRRSSSGSIPLETSDTTDLISEEETEVVEIADIMEEATSIATKEKKNDKKKSKKTRKKGTFSITSKKKSTFSMAKKPSVVLAAAVFVIGRRALSLWLGQGFM